MNTNRKNKQWLRNKDQLKNPKIFQVTMMRNTDGSFHMIGGQSKVLIRKNQYAGEWVNVDTRDLACEMRNSRLNAF